jgi:hypothetical protein
LFLLARERSQRCKLTVGVLDVEGRRCSVLLRPSRLAEEDRSSSSRSGASELWRCSVLAAASSSLFPASFSIFYPVWCAWGCHRGAVAWVGGLGFPALLIPGYGNLGGRWQMREVHPTVA